MVLLKLRSSAIFIWAVLLGGVWALTTLEFNTQFLPILPASLPSVRGLTDFARLAGGQDEIFLVPDPSLSKPRRKAIIESLGPKISSLPGVRRAESPGQVVMEHPGTLAAWFLLNSPPTIFEQVASALDPELVRRKLERIPEQLSGVIDPADLFHLQIDPLGLFDGLGSSNSPEVYSQFEENRGDDFLMISPAQVNGGTERDCALLDQLETALDQYLNAEDRTHVLLTGGPVFNAQISRQMRADVHVMVGSGLLLLTLAFFGFYRTLVPLPWILFFQILTVLCGVITARLLFGELNVISIGFASILLGVGMDYYILVYHHLASPHRHNQQVWATLKRGIWFSAGVTSCSFLFLAFSHFPGLQQMAVLVGVGLFTTALCATWLLKIVLETNLQDAPVLVFTASGKLAGWVDRNRRGLLLLTTGVVLSFFFQHPWNRVSDLYNTDVEALQPSGISAFKGHKWLEKLNPSAGDSLFMLRGPSHDLIRSALPIVAEAVSLTSRLEQAWLMPSEFHQASNLAMWSPHFTGLLRDAFDTAGLGDEWSRPTLEFTGTLDEARVHGMAAFIHVSGFLRSVAGSDSEGAYAVLRIGDPLSPRKSVKELDRLCPPIKVRPVSWVSLKSEVSDLARNEFISLGLAMVLTVVLLCWFAQRSFRMVTLNLIALLVSLMLFGSLLLLTGTAMTVITLVSIPLLVGLVIDFSLHLLMTLQYQQGDLHGTFKHLAAPMLLTGLSSSIGFGAPMLTGQPAMQNFGLVMDLGILSAVFSCLFLLPPLYFLFSRAGDYRTRLFYRFLYRATGFEIIRFGWWLLGGTLVKAIARSIGLGYALTHHKTMTAVRKNLALFDPERATFLRACRLFMNQAESLTNYGRLSIAAPSEVLHMVGAREGFEHLQSALKRDEGCLLVTGHLGFFEFGGLLMSEMGFPITALTLPEPSTKLTKWRADFRKRWNIDTIVIGDGSFSVLDVVRAIQKKRFVALLIDRPFDQHAIEVTMPNGKVLFSTGPALIALLAKCPIVPVGVLREHDGKFKIIASDFIEPKWLPEGREATLDYYTREIAKSLIPLFASDPEQWFHFAPLGSSPSTS